MDLRAHFVDRLVVSTTDSVTVRQMVNAHFLSPASVRPRPAISLSRLARNTPRIPIPLPMVCYRILPQNTWHDGIRIIVTIVPIDRKSFRFIFWPNYLKFELVQVSSIFIISLLKSNLVHFHIPLLEKWGQYRNQIIFWSVMMDLRAHFVDRLVVSTTDSVTVRQMVNAHFLSPASVRPRPAISLSRLARNTPRIPIPLPMVCYRILPSRPHLRYGSLCLAPPSSSSMW